MSICAEMPRYLSHKTVWALKIKAVSHLSCGSAILFFEEEPYAARMFPASYVTKHDPKPGGYLVVYDDGYLSWSPAEAFEAGYTRIKQ